MRYIYAIEYERWSWKQEIKKKCAQYVDRKFAMKFMIINKTVTNQNRFNFFKIYIYVNKAILLIFEWNKYTPNNN